MELSEKFEILNCVDAPVVAVAADGDVLRNSLAASMLREYSDAELAALLADGKALGERGLAAAESRFAGAAVYTLSICAPDVGAADGLKLEERLARNVLQREALINISLVCAYSEGTMDSVFYAVSEAARIMDADCAALFIADDKSETWKAACLWTADGDNADYAVRTEIPSGEFAAVEKRLDEKSCTILTGMAEARIVSGADSGVCAARVDTENGRRAVLWMEKRRADETWASGDISFVYVLVGVLKMALKRSQMEKELNQALRSANAANMAKTEFLSSVSHEIRTPINAVLGMTHLAMESSDLSEIQANLRRVESAGKHLLGIITDLLDISRIEAGRLDLSPSDFVLAEMLENVSDMIGISAQAKGLSYSCRCGDGLPEYIRADQQRLSQVLINLLNNAVKFTDSGSVSLHISRRMTDDGDRLCLEVADTGRGIRSDDLPRLYKAFERLEDGSAHHTEGTGLGLNITKSIVSAMGGTIDVQSVYGEGTVFTVLLPLVAGSGESVSHQGCGSFTAPDARVLVADDNEINRTVTLGMLSRHGIKADTAVNGREAVSLAAGRTYDVIFMDQMMPVMDGRTACRAIRAGGCSVSSPVIALTADAAAAAKISFLHGGMNDVLTKPVFPEQLAAMLLKWLPEELVIRSDAEAETPAPESAADDYGIPGVQAAEAAELMGCGREFYIEALRLTAENLPGAMKKQRGLLERSDLHSLRIESHGVKGVLNTVGAYSAAQLALSVEQAAASGSAAMAREVFEPYSAAVLDIYGAICRFIERTGGNGQ